MANIPLPGNQFIHNKHYLAINPNPDDNNLCIAFGVPSDRDEPTEGSVEGTIRCFTSFEAQSINDTIVYAQGIRNSVGFEFHPENVNELWFTDCGPDFIVTEVGQPDDELNNVTNITNEGQNFGFPYCHTQGFGNIEQRNAGERANIIDDEFAGPLNITCDEEDYFPAYQPLGPRVASLGMKFVFTEQITSIPNRFILIAQHGSISSNPLIGFRVMLVEFFGNGFQEIVSYQPFATGWLDAENQEYYGRPVDVEWLRNNDRDNGYIVSDDYANVIYRIYYEPDVAVEE